MPPLETLNNDNPKEEIMLPGESGKAIDLSSKGFHKIRQLGEGEFGEVFLYYYNGSNPAYLKMCDSKGMVAVKHMNQPDVHEQAAAKIITKHSELGQLDLSAINRIYPLEEDGELIGLLSEYEAYLDIKDESGQAVEFSSNLYALIAKTFHPRYSHQFPGAGVFTALKSNPAVFLSQIASGMIKGQDTLHQMSILHQDSAARNFLIRTKRDAAGNVLSILPKISDYGLTSILAEGETNGVYTNKYKVPLHIIDAEVMKTEGKTSLLTDYYARKTAMMSILSQMLAPLHGEMESLSMKPGESQSIRDFLADRVGLFLDDSAALKQHLNNVKAYLDKCPDKHLKQEVELFIACYEPWLTFYPAGDDLKKARQDEMTLFEQCTNQFIDRYYEYLILNRKAFPEEHYLLSLQRLNAIEVSHPDKATQSMIQGNIRQLEREWSKKTTPSEPVEEQSLSHESPTMEQPGIRDHYGRIISAPAPVRTAAVDHDGQTHYNNLLSKELFSAPAIQGSVPSEHPPTTTNPSSHYGRSPTLTNPSGERKETHSSGIIPGQLMNSASARNPHPSQNQTPSNQGQDGHYTSLKQSKAQSVKKAEYRPMPHVPHTSKEQDQTKGNDSHIIGTRSHPVNLPSTHPTGADVTRKLKNAIPQVHGEQAERHEGSSSRSKTSIKTIWSDFVHEVEHQLDKLSPKDNVEEIRQKFKGILKGAQKEIKTLLHIKSTPAKAPPKDEDEGDTESYHP